MEVIYLGVDIAGASNTWACGLSPSEEGLSICLSPAKQTLAGELCGAE